MISTSHRPLRALAIASAALLAGCADASRTTAPGATAARAGGAPGPYVAVARDTPLSALPSAAALITPAGGVLALPEAGLRVVFPAGAVAQDVQISVQATSAGRVAYSFAPHGLRFAVPVQVSQSLGQRVIASGAANRMVATYLASGFADAADAGFTPDEVLSVRIDAAAGAAAFTIQHFSEYQLASGRSSSKNSSSTSDKDAALVP